MESKTADNSDTVAVTAPKTKHFIDSTQNCILDALDGMLLTNNNITRIYGNDTSIKVVYRNDWDNNVDKVALICGGGSGHEL